MIKISKSLLAESLNFVPINEPIIEPTTINTISTIFSKSVEVITANTGILAK
jgi:hypothetical protein